MWSRRDLIFLIYWKSCSMDVRVCEISRERFTYARVPHIRENDCGMLVKINERAATCSWYATGQLKLTREVTDCKSDRMLVVAPCFLLCDRPTKTNTDCRHLWQKCEKFSKRRLKIRHDFGRFRKIVLRQSMKTFFRKFKIFISEIPSFYSVYFKSFGLENHSEK